MKMPAFGNKNQNGQPKEQTPKKEKAPKVKAPKQPKPKKTPKDIDDKDVKFKRGDILNDSNIDVVNIEFDGSETDRIEIIGDIQESKGKKALPYVVFGIVCALIFALVFGCIWCVINMKVVQGNVDGAIANVGGISFVEKDYKPHIFLKEGSVIYYDGDSDKFFNGKNEFSIAKVEKITPGKIYLESDSYIREDSINPSQLDFVLISE